jgi:hypothetical protein
MVVFVNNSARKVIKDAMKHARYQSITYYYYRGLVPYVPQVTGFGPTIWIPSVPPSAKRLGNCTPYTRYSPTTPGSEGGSTHLKKN